MFTRRLILILVAMSLLIVLVPACGGGDDDDGTTSPTGQATTTTTTQPATTTSDKPIKIGVINAWSGAAAMSGLFYIDPLMKVVEKQVKDMGGILGGRPVEFIKYDNGGEVAKAVAGAQKLIMQDKVSVLTLGGVSGAEATAIADVAEEEKVLFASVIPLNDIADRKYSVQCSISMQSVVEDSTKIVLEVLKPTPKTVGVMGLDEPETRGWMAKFKQNMKAAGIDVVYEQYLSPGISDLSPYLTKLKYADPQVFLCDGGNNQMLAAAKQIMDIGGWGDIQLVGFGNALSAAKLPGAVGWIVMSPWNSALVDPESLKLKEYYAAQNGGKVPADMHVYIYNTLWTAIHAIELAGTDDPVAVARAARSGNLEFATPGGKAHFGTDGDSGLRNIYVQIQKGGTTVPFPQ